MSKDPAVLFYTGDFLNGCTCLTMEERGQYISMLCLQHQLGHLSEKTIRLSVGSVSVDVLKKFAKDQDGNFFNERMESEIQKRSQYIDSRRDNGAKGGRPKKPYAKPYVKAKEKHSEDRDINENNNKDYIGAEFKNCFETWLQYKTERKESYKSELSLKTCYNNLLKLSGENPEVALKIIEQSMANNWAGLFPLKINNNENSSRDSKRSVKRINDEWNN